jgi:hypothetical protein
MAIKLTRIELHALVWDRPMTKLAAEFSLSDVALHKICRKHDVPTPPVGYWAKKAHGKPVKVKPLPRPDEAGSISILKAPIYVGDIPHRGIVYPGQHEAIIDRDMWDRVQAKLAESVRGERRAARASSSSLLAGKVIDATGAALIASHACKGNKRYRYYISAPDEDGASGLRVPAIEVETAVANSPNI